jgi:DNA-binding transcriptional ArsR family regulator
VVALELDADVIGNARFALSPLAEVACSLLVLGCSAPPAVHRGWIERVRPGLRAADMDLFDLLVPPGRGLSPDFFFPTPRQPEMSFDQQVSELSDEPRDSLEAEIESVWCGLDQPPALTRLLRHRGLVPQIQGALRHYWELAIAPYWPGLRSVLDDDVAHRARVAMRHGMLQLFGDLHPQIVLDASRLHLSPTVDVAQVYVGAELTLVPSVFAWGNYVVSHARPGQFQVVYGARGAGRPWADLQGGGEGTRDLGLSELLGPRRAEVLRLLTLPRTTTQIARTLHLSPAATSRHLTVLHRSALASRRRSGRDVYYQQSAMGASLVRLGADGV